MSKLKKTKNYARMYGKALSGVPVTEYKDLLIQGKDGKLKKIKPLDVTYEGSSFGLILDLYNELKEQYNAYQNATGHSISTLISLLKSKGYNTSNVDLNALIEDINRLVIIEPDKQYTVYHKNANDYVVSSSVIISNDTILLDGERPDDYNKGYWKIVDDEWVLDKDLYEQMWRSL